jgi:ATP-binding cassette subfamily F protein 3
MTALDAVLAADPNWTAERVRSLLGSLLLSGDDAFKPIGQLSGGQRSRVILAQLVVQSANVLLLDEPTNHLDIPSTEIVQNLLQNFTGTLLFVSHDRYLVQAAATHIWAIDGGSIRAIPGGWEEYLQWRNERRNTSDQTPAQAKEQRKVEYRQARKQANLMQRLKRRHDELETEIETTEHELKKLNEAITAAGEAGDLARIEQLGREYQQKDAHLKALWDQWEQVCEELE